MWLTRGPSEHALCLSTSIMMMGRFAAVCLGLVLAGCPTSVDPGLGGDDNPDCDPETNSWP